MIIQCNDVLIENCRFWHTENEALMIMTGWTENLWCEGVGVTNCVVRNCTFDNCQAGARGTLTVGTVPSFAGVCPQSKALQN